MRALLYLYDAFRLQPAMTKLLIAAAFTAMAFAQQEIPVLPVQGNVYMLIGSTGNTTVQAGPDGIVVVDTQTGSAAPQLMAAIRKISNKPVLWIINTSLDSAHIGGNDALIKLGD